VSEFGKTLDEQQDVETEQDLRDTAIRLQRQLARAKAKTEDLIDAVYRGARDAAVLSPPIIAKPPADRRKGKAEVALWHLTDWQGGKRTTSYGLDVMHARVERFCRKAAVITEIQRKDHPIRECVIALGGDMIENVQTFPGQAWLVDATLFEQVFAVASRIEWAVQQALQLYEKVTVVGEPGNHGRIGKRGDVAIGDNWDRIVYEIVRQRLHVPASRLTWVSEDNWHQKIEVGNYRALLIHGDEIKGFGGNVPAYALMRKGNAWASGAAQWEFRDIYVGHYHQPMQLTLANGGQLYMSGSTESDNAYAQEFMAATSVPSQRLHFIDPEKGRVTASYVIWLD
jgi:hypothetical protein